MKEIVKEIIEIGGVEYSLFLNRKGIIAWEKYAKKEAEIVRKVSVEASQLNLDSEDKIDDNTNPFKGLEQVDDMDKNQEILTLYFQKLYWIMLYENHKFSLEKAKELYNLACDEYGEEQVIQLANQMLEDANVNPNKAGELKNLKALRPAK